MEARPAKDGYLEVVVRLNDYRHIPDRLFLTPSADARLRQLREEHALTSGRYPTPEHEYVSVFMVFYKSKQMAVSKSERDSVAQGYCARLIGLYAQLTEAERGEVKRYSATPVGYPRIDHQGEVEMWCRDK